MKKVRFIICILLIASTVFALAPKAMAGASFRFGPQALKLYELGLFTGTSSTGFVPDLGAVLNRQLGVTLLLNLFGKKEAVMAMNQDEVNVILSRYKDQGAIDHWARPYIAYAVKSGLFMGSSQNTLDPLQPLSGTAYATMLLRLLGYKIEGLAYLSSLQTLNEKGGVNKNQIVYFNKPTLIKDDAIGLTYYALFAACSNGESLIEKLIREGTVSIDVTLPENLTDYIKSVRSVNKPEAYKQVYYKVLDAMLNGTTSVSIPRNVYTDTLEEVVNIVRACWSENPELIYYNSCQYSSNGILTLNYGVSSETVRKNTRTLLRKLKILSELLILPGMSDFQKELTIHDYIVEHCDYDVHGYKSGQATRESFSAYGALCLGKAACDGYSKATYLLLERAGIFNMIVVGESAGVSHSWNIVRLGNGYYHLDTTWDDPVMSDGSKALLYRYFNITDEEMRATHKWTASNYVACNAKEYNYYVYNCLTVDSKNEFISKALEKVRSGEKVFSLKVSNFKKIGFNISTAVDEIVKRLNMGCRYSFCSDIGIADLSFD